MNPVVLHLRAHDVAFETYWEVCSALVGITPVVQSLPPDSALLDVTGALRYWQRTPTGIADLIQTRITARFGLTTSIGAAGTRMLATMLCDTLAPGEVRILAPDHALAFLHRQPLRALPGIGAALDKALHRYGLATVADLAALPRATVQRIAGASTGRLLHDRAHGRDPRRITPAGPPPTITAKRSFDHDVLDPDLARRALVSLAVELGARLRHGQQCTRQLELQITFADRSHHTRSRTLTEASAHTPRLQETLHTLYSAMALQRARIRAITARVGRLQSQATTAVQLTFDRATEDARGLEPVLDRANHRWGPATVTPAVLTTPPGRRSRLPTPRSLDKPIPRVGTDSYAHQNDHARGRRWTTHKHGQAARPAPGTPTRD